MATWHNVHFATSYPALHPPHNVFLKLGPTYEMGPWNFGQFAIREFTGGYRVKGIEIPFAPGLKDVGDGARAAGTVTVEGWVHFANTYESDLSAKAILGYFSPGGVPRTDFFVYYSYGDFPDELEGSAQKLRRLQSWRIGELEGWGGERWDVSLTFPVFDPEF